jgi:hypothetical protein
MAKRLSMLLVLAAMGCKNFDGPCAAWQKPRADQPGLSIEEQQRRGRDKYAILEDDRRIGPELQMDRGGPTGR